MLEFPAVSPSGPGATVPAGNAFTYTSRYRYRAVARSGTSVRTVTLRSGPLYPRRGTAGRVEGSCRMSGPADVDQTVPTPLSPLMVPAAGRVPLRRRGFADRPLGDPNPLVWLRSRFLRGWRGAGRAPVIPPVLPPRRVT